eukprot:749534-Hanusia_phi.AAC.1
MAAAARSARSASERFCSLRAMPPRCIHSSKVTSWSSMSCWLCEDRGGEGEEKEGGGRERERQEEREGEEEEMVEEWRGKRRRWSR